LHCSLRSAAAVRDWGEHDPQERVAPSSRDTCVGNGRPDAASLPTCSTGDAYLRPDCGARPAPTSLSTDGRLWSALPRSRPAVTKEPTVRRRPETRQRRCRRLSQCTPRIGPPFPRLSANERPEGAARFASRLRGTAGGGAWPTDRLRRALVVTTLGGIIKGNRLLTCARRGTRTPTPLPAKAFEASASTDSAIRASGLDNGA
jgi:hypothetical protein